MINATRSRFLSSAVVIIPAPTTCLTAVFHCHNDGKIADKRHTVIRDER